MNAFLLFGRKLAIDIDSLFQQKEYQSFDLENNDVLKQKSDNIHTKECKQFLLSAKSGNNFCEGVTLLVSL